MNLRKQVGPAVWLLVLLSRFTPPNWGGFQTVLIADGNLVTDAELAAWLDVKPSTAANWRRRLKAAGFLDWLSGSHPPLGPALLNQPRTTTPLAVQ